MRTFALRFACGLAGGFVSVLQLHGCAGSDTAESPVASGPIGGVTAPANSATAGTSVAAAGGGAGAGPAVPGAPSSSGAAGSPSNGAGAGSPGTEPMAPNTPPGDPAQPPATGANGYDYDGEQVALDADLVIASGETLRVGPGTTFTASANVKVQVEGTLVVEGTSAARVRFLGAGTPRSWHGIVVAAGGTLTASQLEIAGATYGIHALPGSSYHVDYAEIGTSFKAAVVQADGSFQHTRFHASGDPTFSPVNEVSIDDVNGTLTILDASPTVTDSTFDGSAALVDMVRIGGNASPTFDRVHIKEAHCGIHANGGVNNAPIVRNAVFESLAYGLMVYATKPTIEDSVFLMNGNDIGFCFDATADNVPTMSGNYYSSGSAIIDPSCFQIGTADASPSAVPNPSAGPVGL